MSEQKNDWIRRYIDHLGAQEDSMSFVTEHLLHEMQKQVRDTPEYYAFQEVQLFACRRSTELMEIRTQFENFVKGVMVTP